MLTRPPKSSASLSAERLSTLTVTVRVMLDPRNRVIPRFSLAEAAFARRAAPTPQSGQRTNRQPGSRTIQPTGQRLTSMCSQGRDSLLATQAILGPLVVGRMSPASSMVRTASTRSSGSSFRRKPRHWLASFWLPSRMSTIA